MQNNLSLILLSLRFILATLLYTFLVYSIYILWKNFKTSLIPLTQVSTPEIQLLYNNQKFIFQQQEIFLGRSQNCDLHIENSTVSSNHARIYYSQNQWWIEDSNSSNGSRLNSIDISIPTVLTNQDELELGNAIIQIALS